MKPRTEQQRQRVRTVLKQFGDAIKTRRLAVNMTQRQLSEDAGRDSHSYVTNIELGNVAPSLAGMVELADALDCRLRIELIPNSISDADPLGDALNSGDGVYRP